MVKSSDFGKDFQWGASISAAQTEGFHHDQEKGIHIWDTYVSINKKLKREKYLTGPDFLKNFERDISTLEQAGLRNFRYSVSWSRICKSKSSRLDEKGLEGYIKIAETCIAKGITPWVCLYHWDLPQHLEDEGGWTQRNIVDKFLQMAEFVADKMGHLVNHWLVLNEPTVFTGAGYFLGIHAPGKTGLSSFLPALHHAALAQAEGIKLLQNFNEKFKVGTTFSFTHIEPKNQKEKHIKAAEKIHAILNRLYLDPLLGKGYPVNTLPFLKKVEKYFQDGDEEKIQANPHFIGAQIYTREIIKYAPLQPYLQARNIPAIKRNKTTTAMGWEFYPESVGKVLEWLESYNNLPEVVITENGIALDDVPQNGRVIDFQRIEYHRRALDSLREVIKKGNIRVTGYFIWSLIDNFEWAEGYTPRFGLVYVDHVTGERIHKLSHSWLAHFLNKTQ